MTEAVAVAETESVTVTGAVSVAETESVTVTGAVSVAESVGIVLVMRLCFSNPLKKQALPKSGLILYNHPGVLWLT